MNQSVRPVIKVGINITDVNVAVQKQLLKEQLQYLDYLAAADEVEKQKEAERERLVREDQQEQNNRQLRLQKLDAAARRRLLCDVIAVQQQQRQEKGKTYPLISRLSSFSRKMLIFPYSSSRIRT